MAAQSRLIFVNLPVSDLAATQEFFGALGFTFDAKFAGETCACMVISEQAYAMFLTRERYADFTAKPIADGSTSEAILCVSAESRDGVDELADAALAAGGTPAAEAQDHGFMYGRSFFDLDGHHWEVMWMDAAAAQAGPSEFAEQAA